MSESPRPFRVEISESIATITLDRPDRLNALDIPTLEGLAKELAAFHADDDVRAVIITGAGKAFCSGGDLRNISQFGEHRSDGFRYGAGVFHQAILAIHSLGKPVIAAIQGVAAGGGMSLALACDVRVMADDAFMQVGYLGRGLSPDGGLSFTLPRLVGPKRALEIALADERLDGPRCERLGLVSQLCPRGNVVARAREIAAKLGRGPSFAIAQTKSLMTSSIGSSLADILERERVALADCADSPEGAEGLGAFLDKRQPDFVAARRARSS